MANTVSLPQTQSSHRLSRVDHLHHLNCKAVSHYFAISFSFACFLCDFLALARSANENTFLLTLSPWSLLGARIEYTHGSLMSHTDVISRGPWLAASTCRDTVWTNPRGGAKYITTFSESLQAAHRLFFGARVSRAWTPPSPLHTESKNKNLAGAEL